MIIIQLTKNGSIKRQGSITKNITTRLCMPDEETKIQITTDIPVRAEEHNIFIRTFYSDGKYVSNMWKIFKETDRKEGFDNTSLLALTSLREPTLEEWETLAKINKKELYLYRQHSIYIVREGKPHSGDIKWDGETLHYRSDDRYIEKVYLSIVDELN